MPPPATQLDANQVLTHSFDEANGRIRVDAVAVVVGGDITIEASHDNDSIQVWGTDGVQDRQLLTDTNGALIVNQGTDPWNVNVTNAVLDVNVVSGVVLEVEISHDNDSIQVWGTDGLVDRQLLTDSTGKLIVNQGTSPWVVSGTVTTSPDVNIHDGAGNSLTSQLNGGQRALDIGINVAGVQVDPRDIRSLSSATDSVSISNLPTALDTNYGIVGANTLRTAAQIGNSNGEAAFSGGTTNSQTLRVVLPTDQSAIPATQSGTWTVNQGTQALPGNAWYVAITDGASTVGITGFSLNVDVTNGAGAAAVNIKDGGNSITVDGTVTTTQGTSPWVSNITQFGSSAVVTGTGASGAGIPRVTVANDSNILATQSGTWNINNISGTISLPTGAATSANQTTQITSLQLLDDVPSAFNAAFVKGNPVMGQLDDTSTVVATEDNVAPVRITAQRALHTNLRNNAGTEIATSANPLRIDPTGTTAQPVTDNGGSLTVDGTVATTQSGTWSNQVVDGSGNIWGPRTSSGSVNWFPVINLEGATTGAAVAPRTLQIGGSDGTNLRTLATDTSGRLSVNSIPNDGIKATYSASVTNLSTSLLATDIFTITGSATKTVRITQILITGTRTTSQNNDFVFIKRSTANTGGTSTTLTSVPYDSTSAAGTAVVRAYTANPTLGTAIGTMISTNLFLNATASGASDRAAFTFGNRPAQAIVLRGTSEVLAINLAGVTIATPSLDITIEYTEE